MNKSLDPFISGVFLLLLLSSILKSNGPSSKLELVICSLSCLAAEHLLSPCNNLMNLATVVNLSSVMWIFPEKLDSLNSHRHSLTCECSFSSLQLLTDCCFICVFDLNESHTLLYK